MTDNDRLNLLFDLRRYRDAAEVAREAIAKNPEWGAGYTHLARALINLNKKDEAIAAAREGARKEPRDAWAIGTLACALNWFGQSKEALGPALEAVRLDHRYPWVHAMLANILFNLNRFEDARRQAVAGLNHDPLCESLFRWKGWAEHKLDRHDQALATANEGLKHHPNSHLIMNLVGCIRWSLAEKTWGPRRLRGHREADAILREAVRLDPAQQAYRDNLRGNAASCRQHVGGLLPALCILLVVAPVCLIGMAVISAQGRDWLVTVVATICAFVVSLLASDSRAVQSLRLERWNIPEVPIPDEERRKGQIELRLLGLVMLIPWAIAVVVWFW